MPLVVLALLPVGAEPRAEVAGEKEEVAAAEAAEEACLLCGPRCAVGALMSKMPCDVCVCGLKGKSSIMEEKYTQ